MAPADRHDLTGTVLAGRYRIVRKLGEGAMGAVYLGEHLRIGRLDAIKVMRGGLAEDSDSITRFNRGARHLSAIRHPNVCTLYDYGETEDGSPFLALELIEGESLKEIIDREGALPVPRALAIARQIAAALQAAHDAGIVHRDLKPGNVMIERGRDGSDVVKVVDFDIAKGPEARTGDEVTELGFVVGTPEYMSPEQLMGERLDGRSDLYSLGLVLFRMVSGALPFRGGSTQEIMLQRLTTEPLTLGQIRAGLSGTPGLQAVLDRSLAREKEKRHANATEFAADLDRLAAGQAPAAPAAGARATGGREMPETVVASSTSRPAVAGATGGGSSRRGWLIGVVAALAIGAAGTPFLLRSLGAEDGQAPGPLAANPSATIDSAGMVTRIDSQKPIHTPPVRGEDSARKPAPRPQLPPDPAPSGGGIVVAAADANDTLFRLLDRLTESKDAGIASAARDTASAVWENGTVASDDRALAAYVAASAFLNLRNAAECERWIDRALQLRPGGPGYADLRTSCRSMSP
jgi:serine/threonine-protein kinase